MKRRKIICQMSALCMSAMLGLIPAADVRAEGKEEVVYASMDSSGHVEEIYVVNIFDGGSGELIDYGKYSTVKNLTDQNTIDYSGGQVTAEAGEGRFYYQGNMEEKDLPWNVDISYSLNDRKKTAEEIAGETGKVKLHIKTVPNKNITDTFYKNYLLQISVTLDTQICKDIVTEDATEANAGSDKLFTYTIMPDTEGYITLEMQAEEFYMDGVDISAVPFSMAFDIPDTDEMTGEFSVLTDAIDQLNDGVGDLTDGVSELNQGTSQLESGASAFGTGLQKAASNSSQLTSASSEIKSALKQVDRGLQNGLGDLDLSSFKKLSKGLLEMKKGMGELKSGIKKLKNGFTEGYQALDSAMKGIPEYDISEQDIGGLYASGADPGTVKKLVETYAAARTAKGTYTAVSPAFEAVKTELGSIESAVGTMETNLGEVVSQLDKALNNNDIEGSMKTLSKGISKLAESYGKFHKGLNAYTDGVGQLNRGYRQISNGISELSSGTSQLYNGTEELHSGTREMKMETEDLPEKVQEAVDELVSSYDYSDFEPESFVSEKNESVEAVQFVLKTGGVEKPEEEEEEIQEEKKEGLFDRFINLFK